VALCFFLNVSCAILRVSGKVSSVVAFLKASFGN